MKITNYDFVGLLSFITGIPGWTEVQGPSSKCGLDYHYQIGPSNDSKFLWAYINVDQTEVSISVRDVEDLDASSFPLLFEINALNTLPAYASYVTVHDTQTEESNTSTSPNT
jgi:hypothetical protein